MMLIPRPKQDATLDGALVLEVEDTSQNPVHAASFLSPFNCQPQGFINFMQVSTFKVWFTSFPIQKKALY